MKINKYLFTGFFIFILVTIFRILFTLSALQGGDYNSPTSDIIKIASNMFAWCDYAALGYNCAAVNLHSYPMWVVIGLGGNLGIPVYLLERIFWWFPFIILSYISSAFLYKKIFPENDFFIISSIIYTVNTYILLVVGGGQIAGIALAYAIFPFVIFLSIWALKKNTLISSVLLGVAFSISLTFDLRSSYIILFACFLLYVWTIFSNKNTLKNIITRLKVFTSALLVMVLFHFYWILPTIIVHKNPVAQLGGAYSSSLSAKYYSFATFEDTIGLLHPNWPENIFGKVSFMRPEFLILPILAYSSLFFIKKTSYNKQNIQQRLVLYFAFLGLIGAFLSKGANNPFGSFYLWSFTNIPGFNAFRDSTKWYMLICLSYSILIPYSLSHFSAIIHTKLTAKNNEK